MAVTIPTLSSLYTSILADLESELNVNIPLVGKNYLRAVAAVQAAKLKLFYLAIASIQKNIFVDTAESVTVGGTLERFGLVKLGRNPFPAVAGQYTCTVTGEIGAVIPANTTFKSDDDSLNPSQIFILDAELTFVAASESIDLRALEAGLVSQLQVGDTLTVTQPIANVDDTATVTAELVAPLAAEDLEDYRTLAINAYQTEPQGGAATDYRLWASDAQGVAKVYPYAKTGFANELEVYVEATIADSVDGKGTPTAGILTEVEDVIDFDPDVTKPLNERGRRPLGIFNIDFIAITPLNVGITITGYVGLTAGIQTTINDAITAALAEVRPFVAAADVEANKNDIFSEFDIAFIIQQAVPSSIFTSVTLEVDSVAVSSYTFTDGDIPYLNSITYA